MSSPRQNTLSSRSISSKSASRMASRYVISAIGLLIRGVNAPSLRALVRLHDRVGSPVPVRALARRIGVDALECVERWRRWRLLRFVRRGVDLVPDASVDRLQLLRGESELAEQALDVAI